MTSGTVEGTETSGPVEGTETSGPVEGTETPGVSPSDDFALDDDTAPRRSQAERRAESERRLLSATIKLVAQHGSEGTSLAHIAEAAGCSRGLPVYLFGSKQGLLLAVVDETMRRFQQRHLEPALAGKRGVEAVEISLRAFLSTLREPTPATRAFNVLLGEAVGPQRDFAEPINRLHRGVQQFFADRLREAIADGSARTDLDAEALGWTLVAILRGSSFLSLADPAAVGVDGLIDAAIDAVRRTVAPAPYRA